MDKDARYDLMRRASVAVGQCGYRSVYTDTYIVVLADRGGEPVEVAGIDWQGERFKVWATESSALEELTTQLILAGVPGWSI